MSYLTVLGPLLRSVKLEDSENTACASNASFSPANTPQTVTARHQAAKKTMDLAAQKRREEFQPEDREFDAPTSRPSLPKWIPGRPKRPIGADEINVLTPRLIRRKPESRFGSPMSVAP
ncbi:hypothetical protein [Sinorhizobium meliloti]|uniref:hypothetical protein n=1 Tax=Rhizobium meliloti TaxID=382 RepID=UPI001F304306|nr:hypothetical protein [Sinorhizobium meliloti]